MQRRKQFCFLVAAALAIGIVGYGLYTRMPVWQAGDSRVQPTIAAAADRAVQSDQSPAKDGATAVESSRKVRHVVLRLKPKSDRSEIAGSELVTSLKALDSVKDATLEGRSVRLTISGPVRLSEVVKHLSDRGAALVENETSLQGDMRLHISGLT